MASLVFWGYWSQSRTNLQTTSQSTDIESEALHPECRAVLEHGEGEDACSTGQTSWELRASVPHHPQKRKQLSIQPIQS